MAIQAGNMFYNDPTSLPRTVPVFPLSGALLLPTGHLPLNIFEPRYLAMVEHALRTDRLIGMIQPRMQQAQGCSRPDLCAVGCIGRIIQLSETGDGRYLITLAGVARFDMIQEFQADTLFRQCEVCAKRFVEDFDPECGENDVDRDALLAALQAYLEANDLEADWASVEKASNAGLVTTLSMMSPWGPAEKQALIEAPDLRARAETLIAIARFALASGDETPSSVQ